MPVPPSPPAPSPSSASEAEVVGTYALPWEERPEYDEVMATYGHGM